MDHGVLCRKFEHILGMIPIPNYGAFNRSRPYQITRIIRCSSKVPVIIPKTRVEVDRGGPSIPGGWGPFLKNKVATIVPRQGGHIEVDIPVSVPRLLPPFA